MRGWSSINNGPFSQRIYSVVDDVLIACGVVILCVCLSFEVSGDGVTRLESLTQLV